MSDTSVVDYETPLRTGGKKLPPIDVLYWIMIISANTIGETAGDLISMTFNVGYGASTIILMALFFGFVGLAVWTKIQHASIYWIVIILSSTAGTTLSDLVARNWLGTEEHGAYGAGVLAILFTMVFIFTAWHFIAPRHGIDKPLSRMSELFYWLAIVTSSTLGTAFGDYLTHSTPPGFANEIGFEHATEILAGALVVVTLLTLLTKIPRDFCYWTAIVLTHPLGATAGDYMTKDKEDGGLELGTIKSTIILVAIFLLIVGVKVILNWKKKSSDASPATAIAET